MSGMLPITFVLLFGFTMGNVVKSLDTGTYLSSIFQQFLSPALLPALTFLIAVLISFATGTSMGNYGYYGSYCTSYGIFPWATAFR